MNIYHFTDVIMPYFEAFMYFVLFEAFLERRKTSTRPRMIVVLLVLGSIITISNHLMIHQMGNIVVMALAAFLAACLIYEGRLRKKLMAVILAIFISGAAELLAVHFVSMTFGLQVEDVLIVPEYRFLGIFLSKASAIAVCNIIRIKIRHQDRELGRAYWLIFTLQFVCAFGISFLICRLMLIVPDTTYIFSSLLCVLGLVVSAIFSIYLYERLVAQSRMMLVQERQQQNFRLQRKHFDEIMLKQEALRRFRHDFGNQLMTLDNYFERGDDAGGRQYIASLNAQLEQTRIDSDTGNPALDAIVGSKQALAVSKGIRFQKDVRIPANLAIAPSDACVIFGNILDNAIEACERMTSGEKWISFSLVQQEHVILCKVANAAPDRGRIGLATSKVDKENHGYGLMNIRETLEKYDSTPMISYENGEFTIQFSIVVQ
ncbi:MAG: GHKL domain-containing protein [Peptococcaceae bacterium]|nr:GHKL domain-containing protein [Peptococcaceae bacterium]